MWDFSCSAVFMREKKKKEFCVTVDVKDIILCK